MSNEEKKNISSEEDIRASFEALNLLKKLRSMGMNIGEDVGKGIIDSIPVIEGEKDVEDA